MRRKLLIPWLLGSADLVLICGSFLGAYWLRFTIPGLPHRPQPSLQPYLQLSFLVAFTGVVLLYSSGLYRSRYASSPGSAIGIIIRSATLTHLIVISITFAFRETLTQSPLAAFSRVIIVLSWVLTTLLVLTRHYLYAKILALLYRHGKGLTRILILGSDASGRRFLELARSQPDLGLNVIGTVETLGEEDAESKNVPGLDDLISTIRETYPDEIVVASTAIEPNTLVRITGECVRIGIRLSFIAGYYELLRSQTSAHEIAGIPLFSVEEPLQTRWARALKRTVDVIGATLLLVLTSPLVFACVLIVRFEAPGSMFFRQGRVGKGGRRFTLYKVRSMTQDAESQKSDLTSLNEAVGPLFKIRSDPRTTKVGRLIRKFSIDELPQLYNVLKGEMSLVGPRPPVPEEVAEYDDWQRKRFDVHPGITGLPQVSGRSDLTFDEVIRLDIFYIENWSLALDLQILLKTVWVVLLGRGAY